MRYDYTSKFLLRSHITQYHCGQLQVEVAVRVRWGHAAASSTGATAQCNAVDAAYPHRTLTATLTFSNHSGTVVKFTNSFCILLFSVTLNLPFCLEPLSYCNINRIFYKSKLSTYTMYMTRNQKNQVLPHAYDLVWQITSYVIKS